MAKATPVTAAPEAAEQPAPATEIVATPVSEKPKKATKDELDALLAEAGEAKQASVVGNAVRVDH